MRTETCRATLHLVGGVWFADTQLVGRVLLARNLQSMPDPETGDGADVEVVLSSPMACAEVVSYHYV